MENKSRLNIQLRLHWLWRIPIIAAVLSLLLTIGLRVIPLIVSVICDRVQGWDGLGCTIGGLYIGLIIIGVSLIVFNIVLLKRLVIDSRRMAILITVPVAVFVAATVLSNGLYYVTPDFPTNLLGHILLILLGTISISIIMFFAVIILSHTDKINRTASLILCILLVPGIYSLVSFASANFRSAQYIKGKKDSLKNISFSVYKPAYTPNGYTLSTNPGDPGFQPGGFIAAGKRKLYEPSHYYFRYIYPLSAFNMPTDPNLPSSAYSPPTEYEIFEYKTSPDYNPPDDCGGTVSIISAGGSTFPELDAYGEQVRPCILIGRSTVGCDVYYEEHTTGPYSGGKFGYCKIDSTVVAIVADKVFTDNESLSTQKAEMIKIFDSLKILTPQQLEENALRGAEYRK